MLIKGIKLRNFKNFTQKDVKLSNLVFIKGKNGSGKSTLALDSVLFAFWGYSTSSTLDSLPTRNIAKSCSVEIEFEHDTVTYKLKRNYPTKITIFCNNKEVELTNSIEAQEYITNLVGTRQNFLKFHIVDAYSRESNFLEEGQTTLKRILFANSAVIFNNMRNKLITIKHEREIYNKDKAVVFTHYPSEKRIQLIGCKYKELEKRELAKKREIHTFENSQNKIERELGGVENKLSILESEKDKLLKNIKCYICNQGISEGLQKRLLREIDDKLPKLQNSLKTLKAKLENVNDLIESYREKLTKITNKIHHLIGLERKLEVRIKQKDYKYTQRDIEIVKGAIKEVDKLSTYYLTESIKVLTPIINSVLAKIDFTVDFIVEENGKFNITLWSKGIKYNYKDLSTGQKLILQIAFKLAILMERNENGIIIADEGMSSLDKENLNHILQIFENYPFQLLFVIHNLEEVSNNIQIIDLNKEN